MSEHSKKTRGSIRNTLRAAALAGGAAIIGATSTGCASVMNAGSQITTNLVHAERNRRNHGRDLFSVVGDLVTRPFAEDNVMIEPAAQDIYNSIKNERATIAQIQAQNGIKDADVNTYLLAVRTSKEAADYQELVRARRQLLAMERAQPMLRDIRTVAEAGLAERHVILNQLPASDRQRVLKQVDELSAAEQQKKVAMASRKGQLDRA